MTSGSDGVSEGTQDRYLEAMRDLTAAMSAGDTSTQRRIERVLSVGCTHLEYPNAFLATIDDEYHEITTASGAEAKAAVGVRSALENTYCKHTLETDGIYAVCDTSESTVTDEFGLKSYLGIKINVDGETYGTLCLGDTESPRSELSDWQETFLEHLREWVESELERNRAWERQERSQRLLEATFNSPETFIGVLDADGRVLMGNETALSFVGADIEDVRDKPFADTPWWTHDEESRQKCRDAVERAADGETVQFEATHIGANGEEIATAVTVRPVFKDGEVSEIIAEGTDITDLKAREEQVEFFNSILRHDILNGMNVIRARAELLKGELQGEQADYAETILDWSDEIIALTQKVRSVLSTLSKSTLSDCESVELRPLLESAANRARSMDDGCTIRMDVHDDVTVAGDELLGEVFGNLFTNAVEHAGPGPTIDVSTSVGEGTVAVRIADDGPGIEPENRRSVFERGEKGGASSGTGFGLYFVDAMVDSYGGEVWVEASDSGGAAFVVELRRQ